MCVAEQGMVFRFLSLKHGIQFHYYFFSILNRVCFWTGSLKKSMKAAIE